MEKNFKWIALLFCCYSLLSWTTPATDGEPDKNISDSIVDYQTINEFVVTGTRNVTDVRHLPMTVSVIDRIQLEQSNESSLLSTLVNRTPGLFVTERGILGFGMSTGAAGGITLRGIGGSPNSQMLVLIDGHPQYMGLMGHPISDAYQSQLAEKVEIVRGPASVLYGSNAMGGVINIVTRQNKQEGIWTHARFAAGSYGTATAEVSNMIRCGKYSSLIAASYNRTDGHRPDMAFEQYMGYAKFGYRFDMNWNIYVDGNLTRFSASNPGLITAPRFDNDQRITRGMASLSLENNYEQTSGALKIYYNAGRHKINDGYLAAAAPLDYRFNSKDNMWGLAWYQSATLFSGNRLTIGIDYQNFGGKSWNHFVTDGHEVELSDKTEHETAGYIDFRQILNEVFTFDAGIRYDYHSVSGTEWIPQIGLSAQITSDALLKAMVSKGFRNPTIKELYMFQSANPELKAERLLNYELSYTQHTNAFRYGINIFYINGENLIQTIRTDGKPKNINVGEVENWGAEVEMDWHINTVWNLTANYSWLRMLHPVIAAPEHKAFAEINYNLHKWNLSTGLQYIDGLYTEVSSHTKESFLLWNVNAEYNLSDHIALYTKIENILNKEYEINKGYPMPKATFMTGVKIRL